MTSRDGSAARPRELNRSRVSRPLDLVEGGLSPAQTHRRGRSEPILVSHCSTSRRMRLPPRRCEFRQKSDDSFMEPVAADTENNMAVIRALAEADLPQAQRIVRVAFGTFLGA